MRMNEPTLVEETFVGHRQVLDVRVDKGNHHEEVTTCHGEFKRIPFLMEDGSAFGAHHLHVPVGGEETFATTQKQDELAEWVALQSEPARWKLLENSQRGPSEVLEASHFGDDMVGGSHEGLEDPTTLVDNRPAGVAMCTKVADLLSVRVLEVLSPMVIEVNDRQVVNEESVVCHS